LTAAFLLFWLLPERRALDINMHDTYILGSAFDPNLSSTYFIFNYFIVIGLWAYLIRSLYFNFTLILTNVMLLIFTGLVSYFLSDIMIVIHAPMFKPPVIDNTESVKGLFYGGSYSNSYLWSTRIIKMLLILILVFTGFIIGRKWKRKVIQ